MKQKHKVVLIPTDKPTFPCLVIGTPELGLRYTNERFGTPIAQYFYLYIISDEEIKEDDWILHHDLGIRQHEGGLYASKVWRNKNWSKIIATTNPEIATIIPGYGIQRIPQLFIEAYIKAYNEGKQILEVELEYYDDCLLQQNAVCSCHKTGIACNSGLKLTDKGEVIISPLEEKFYTRKEVEDIAVAVRDEFGKVRLSGYNAKKAVIEWLNKKYPL